MTGDWRPTASITTLRARARLLQQARDFFHRRGILEVETPAVVAHTVTDPQIESMSVEGQPPHWLATSPEYAMKRLLAAGSGDIFQICRVFRAGEVSRLHNPEFTMVEWYRLGLDLPAIMAETAALAAALLAGTPAGKAPVEYLSYADALRRELDCDALTASTTELAALCAQHGLTTSGTAGLGRDALLDFLVATCVGPRLGRGTLCCLHHYPASQAALAMLDPDDPRTALRFELYAEGVELANGYVELADPGEQAHRFEADRAARTARGAVVPGADRRLLAALTAGLPACAGVAMGFDRVAMLALGARSLDAVIAFPWDRA